MRTAHYTDDMRLTLAAQRIDGTVVVDLRPTHCEVATDVTVDGRDVGKVVEYLDTYHGSPYYSVYAYHRGRVGELRAYGHRYTSRDEAVNAVLRTAGAL